MKAKKTSSRRRSERVIAWLPVDSRLLPHLFSFGHVRGWAKVFLQLEIVLALLTIAGTLLIVILRFFSSP